LNSVSPPLYCKYELRLTQPIPLFVDEKGGYTENYTIIHKGSSIDDNGVAFFHQGDFLTDIDDQYPLHVWIQCTSYNKSFEYYTSTFRGNYPDWVGNHQTYGTEHRIRSQDRWDDLWTSVGSDPLLHYDFAVDIIWGSRLSTDLLLEPRSDFQDENNVTQNGWVVDFTEIKIIRSTYSWHATNTIVGEQFANADTEDICNFLDPKNQGRYFPDRSDFQRQLPYIQWAYFDSSVIVQGVSHCGCGPVLAYTAYWCNADGTRTKKKTGSLIITDRNGEHPTYVVGHDKSETIQSGSIDTGLVQNQEKVCCPNATNGAEVCSYPGDPASDPMTTTGTISKHSFIEWTMEDLIKP